MRMLVRLHGFALILALIAWCISLGGSLEVFLDIPSLIILIGITAGGLMASVGPHGAVSAFVAALTDRDRDPHRLIAHIHVMTTAHHLAWGVGMVGMFLGLISMLANMSDPSSIGGGMAVAMIPLFYAALWAELIITPLRAALVRTLGEVEAEPATEDEGDRSPTTSLATAGLGSRRFAAFACVAWVMMLFFICLAAFSDIKHDTEYRDAVISIQKAFGYTPSDTSKRILSPDELKALAEDFTEGAN